LKGTLHAITALIHELIFFLGTMSSKYIIFRKQDQTLCFAVGAYSFLELVQDEYCYFDFTLAYHRFMIFWARSCIYFMDHIGRFFENS